MIGAEQVASVAGQRLRKPGDAQTAVAQLRRCRSQAVVFHTALCVHDGASGDTLSACDLTTVHFRALDDREIERYVAVDRPFDCAGSFRAEALGITLFDRIDSEDPTALIGLPLIALARLLRSADLPLP